MRARYGSVAVLPAAGSITNAMLAGSIARTKLADGITVFTAAAASPGGNDGDLWYNNDGQIFSIRLNSAWHSLLGSILSGASYFQPTTGYRSSDGTPGVTGTEGLVVPSQSKDGLVVVTGS